MGRLRNSIAWPVFYLLWVCLLATTTSASVEYSGALTSFSSPAGIQTTGLWNTEGFDVIGWNVTQNENGSWHYVYGRATSVLNTTHFIIQLPVGFAKADLLNPTGAFSSFDVGTFAPSAVLPFLPSSIYGADFLILPGMDSRVAFDANIKPNFGNYYAQGSPSESSFNTGFLIPNAPHDPTCGSIDHKILVPDTTALPIPDASTIVLLCFGALQLLAVKNKLLR